jgi:hypothetical protein
MTQTQLGTERHFEKEKRMDCECRRCLDEGPKEEMFPGVWMPVGGIRMIVCGICGNKRCPHATDHRNACTNSNDAGQYGSVYGVMPGEKR